MTHAQLEGPLADLSRWEPRGNCSIGKALDVIGTRSAMLVLREAQYGVSRFDDFTRRTGMTEAVVAGRLRELVAVGIMTKVPYQEPGQRARSEYQLTRMGVDLMPTLFALMRWGDEYLAEHGGPLVLRHAECGARVEVQVTCAEGHSVPLDELSISASRRRAANVK